MSAWVPRGVDPASRDVLVDGVPTHLHPALMHFLRERFCRYNGMVGRWYCDYETLIEYDLVARRKPSFSASLSAYGDQWPGLFSHLDGEALLDCADWAIHQDVDHARELERILLSASSAWKVGLRNENFGLVRRVPEAVQEAAEKAMTQGSAGALLSEAWSACYGRSADSEEAYEKAIKAVEEAAAHVVSPKNTRATLGTIIRDMKSQGSWSVDLPGQERGVVVAMLEALWTGQESRHGGNSYRRPTQEEAETAVTLAVALVQLFGFGSVAQRP